MIKPYLCIACGKVSAPVNNGHSGAFGWPCAARLPENAIACGKVICTTGKGC